MSSPIVPETQVFVLNAFNNYSIDKILAPPIQNKSKCRVIASSANVILQISCLRPSFTKLANTPSLTLVDGLAQPDNDIWYDTNSSYIQHIKVSVYQQSVPQYDSISVALQFAEQFGDDTNL